jgi:hypothetical protein
LKFDFATHEQAMAIYKHFYAPVMPESERIDSDMSASESSDTERTRVDDEAEHFADIIKNANIQVSIATIQGFLLLYKREPELVKEKVAKWVDVIRAEQFPAVDEKTRTIDGFSDEIGKEVGDEGEKQGGEVIEDKLEQSKEKPKLKKIERVK